MERDSLVTDSPSPESKRPGMAVHVATAAAVGVVLIVAAALRLRELDTSLWLDEILTHHGSSGSFVDSLTHRTYPLYYALANLCLGFSDTEFALRFPSFIAGLLTLPVVYFLGKVCVGRAGGLLATLLLCLSVYHIRYSQEARYYAIVMLGGVLMTYFLHRCVTRGGRRNWAAFSLSAFFSLLTQLSVLPFFLSLVFGGVLCVAADVKRRGARGTVRRLIILGVAAALSISGLALSMFAQRDSGIGMLDMDSVGAEDEDGAQGVDGLSSHTYSLTVREYVDFIEGFIPVRPAGVQHALAAAACLGMVLLWRRDRAMAALFLVQFLLAPLPYLIFNASHWYASRYFCNLTPLYAVLVAGGIVVLANAPSWLLAWRKREAPASTSRPRRTYLSMALTLAFTAALLPVLWEAIPRYYERRPATDWRAAGDFLASRVQPEDVLVIAPPQLGQDGGDSTPPPSSVLRVPVEFYLRRGLHTYWPRSPHAVAASFAYVNVASGEALRACRAEHPANSIWCVLRNEKRYAPEFRNTLESLGAKRVSRFGKVVIRRLPPQQKAAAPEVTAGNHNAQVQTDDTAHPE